MAARVVRVVAVLAPVLLLLPAASCAKGGADAHPLSAAGLRQADLTVAGKGGTRRFTVELAQTVAQQERGMMFRTSIPADTGMLFWPYPPDRDGKHQSSQDASFWMKNTPSALDIIFIRADGTIARIAENAVPFDETPLPSGEPVAAVLELKGGRTAELGIAAGDKVSWEGR